MAHRGLTARLALASASRPWLTVGLWVVVFLVGGFLASGIGDVVDTEFKQYVETDSDRALDLVDEHLGGDEQSPSAIIVVRSGNLTADDDEFRAVVEDLEARLSALPEVEQVMSAYSSGDQSLVSSDGDATILPVFIGGDDPDSDVEAVIDTARAPAEAYPGFEVATTGEQSINFAFNETAAHDLERAELFGIPAALVILILVFGALVAAGIPIILGVLAIVVAIGVSAVVGQFLDLSVFLINFVTTIGLAVGIDYSLLIIQRFREERSNGLEKIDAIGAAGATASRAIMFSGMAVVIALAGMLIVPNNIFRSLSAGAIFVVIAAVLVGLTLLPAILAILGDRINAPRLGFLRRRTSGRPAGRFWQRMISVVMAHPVVSVVASTALLAGLSIPYFTIELGFNGVSTLPAHTEAARGFAMLEEEFSGGRVSPAEIVVEADDVHAPQVAAAIEELSRLLADDEVFGAPTIEASPGGELALISTPVRGDPQGDLAEDAIDRLRGDHIPSAFAGVNANVFVGGDSAESIDGVAILLDYTPIVLGFVLALSFLILLVVFRSIVVPAKAIVMNLLSVGASYGLLVLVFQHGVLNEVFGFRQVDIIEAWVPLFLFATLFGLSMDYHVFLLSRIRERFDQTGDNAESVVHGVRSTAGIITGAALIMVAVFGGFASGEMVMLQQMGFGLAVAILLDATIVRIVLVPASMQLLGRWNWYLPSWLEWLPDVSVEGARPRQATQATEA
ncbi:MAG: MMPL family transporter [Dehalococcoidia bacterium]|nr:MMPL family transporter [Dehalococcoidia bacterium]